MHSNNICDRNLKIPKAVMRLKPIVVTTTAIPYINQNNQHKTMDFPLICNIIQQKQKMEIFSYVTVQIIETYKKKSEDLESFFRNL